MKRNLRSSGKGILFYTADGVKRPGAQWGKFFFFLANLNEFKNNYNLKSN